MNFPPISKNTLDKPFEFVIIKSESLSKIKQNSDPFNAYLIDMICYEKQVISFPNLDKDEILVIPHKKWSQDLKEFLDYKNLSQFTKNAPEEQQQDFWKEVADNLSQELEKNPDTPRWLNTHGLGVGYLHVRIDERPKHYNYDEYKKWK
ncbi:MAG: hypothetical protein mread185_000713 [Mycoplasmataceae bacterium]|nr:MAG: hypothetical protein mread185_000713 [Mycoplasmataceae bacterium]